MNHVLDELAANKGLLAFIYKDLSWAVFKKALTTPKSSEDIDFSEVYRKMIEESGISFLITSGLMLDKSVMSAKGFCLLNCSITVFT